MLGEFEGFEDVGALEGLEEVGEIEGAREGVFEGLWRFMEISMALNSLGIRIELALVD